MGMRAAAAPEPLQNEPYAVGSPCFLVQTLIVAVSASPRVASMAANRFAFDRPDEVGNLKDGVHTPANLVGRWFGGLPGGRPARRPAAPAQPGERRELRRSPRV